MNGAVSATGKVRVTVENRLALQAGGGWVRRRTGREGEKVPRCWIAQLPAL